MTWSIIARDKNTGQFGIAVATRFFAVVALAPHLKTRVGAIATQALVNVFYGTERLRLLERGAGAREVVAAVIAADAGRDHRQVHVIDARGGIAVHTGKSCVDWCGHLSGDGFSVAGNMLAGADVIKDTAAAYAKNPALSFPRRLIAAMRAGEAAGGDKRGKQSAALIICGEEEWPDLDLRVDDHADPLAELERLERISRERFVHFMRMLPTRNGLVGESGCGKTVTALSVMGLLPRASAEVSGRIWFDGAELLALSDRAMRNLRGDRLAMIFQEPMTSLNPSYSIGEQIAESLVRHRGLSRRQARARTIELLRLVKIPSPEQRVDDYPHRLSGGMRQRAMIALALACDPELLIADEPTTALDVTIQAQILELMRDLKDSTGIAIILITHDLGVVAEICDHVAVMYAGEIVEYAPVDALFAAPQHPYTIGLLGSIPRLDAKTEELAAIEGMVPSLTELPAGCRFAPRCPFARERCTQVSPPLAFVGPGHRSRCIRAPLEQVVA